LQNNSKTNKIILINKSINKLKKIKKKKEKMFGIVPKLQARFLAKCPQGPIYTFCASETGPFTVYFYCSAIKWFITFTNIGDIYIPVERVSSFQQLAMFLTGFTWARYCTQITPINYGLMAANLTMGSVASYQLFRKWKAGQLIE